MLHIPVNLVLRLGRIVFTATRGARGLATTPLLEARVADKVVARRAFDWVIYNVLAYRADKILIELLESVVRAELALICHRL